MLPACGGQVAEPEGLALTITGQETGGPGGGACAYDLTGVNATGRDAANVQIAYTAQTDGAGTQSEYVVLGDFAAGEERQGRIFITGAPCEAILTLKLTRAVCTVELEGGGTESCAGAVTLSGGGVVEMRTE